MRFDYAGMVRLATQSEVRLVELENQRYQLQVPQAVAYDDRDRWNENRDRQLEGSHSYNYVSRDVYYGAGGPDSYGFWQNGPLYGNRQDAGCRDGGRYRNGLGLVNNFNCGYRNARIRNAIAGVDGQGFVSGRRGSAI